jgi:hypothetical protein
MHAHWLGKSILQSWWAPAGVLFFWAAAAKVFGAFAYFPWLDIPTHFAGGVAIAFFFSVAIDNFSPTRIATAISTVSVIGLTALAALVWELLEFASDHYLGSFLIGGVADSLKDMVLGVLGAVVFVSIRKNQTAQPAPPNNPLDR